MKVIVKPTDRERPIVILLPSLMVFSPITAAFGAMCTDYSFRQINNLMKALREAKKQLKGRPLVNVTEKSGEQVQVYL